MKHIYSIIVIIMLFINSATAQNFKIKKGEIFIENQAVAKIKKQKEGYKISSLDDSTWFIAKAINITQTQKRAPKYWLEITGSNGNIRETEYREAPTSLSREKWHVGALITSDTGLLTSSGINSDHVNTFFSTQDRNVSEKWDVWIAEKMEENKQEDDLALRDKLVVAQDGTIKRNGKKVGFLNKTTAGSQPPYYKYTVLNLANQKIAEIGFYRETNLNPELLLKYSNGQNVPLHFVAFSLHHLDLDDLSKRVVNKVNAAGLLSE